MTGQGGPQRVPLTQLDRSNLELEFKELCTDWRTRDNYVLNKLGAAGILFGLLGVALGTLPPESVIIKLGLLVIGAYFSVILIISIAKDTHYRDATEELLRLISAELEISDSLEKIRSSDVFLPHYNGESFAKFVRKISLRPEPSSYFDIPEFLRNLLMKQRTFRWILGFYITSLLIFVCLFILILVNYLAGLELPI